MRSRGERQKVGFEGRDVKWRRWWRG